MNGPGSKADPEDVTNGVEEEAEAGEAWTDGPLAGRCTANGVETGGGGGAIMVLLPLLWLKEAAAPKGGGGWYAVYSATGAS